MWLVRRAHVGLGAAVASVVLIAVPCFAAEGGGIDRPTWNMIMRLVNFGILAFVIYKYGKDPLVKFLAGKRASVVLSLEELQKEKAYLDQQEAEQNALLAAIDEKISGIKGYYHQLGQDEKQKVMERAEASRDHMLEDARLKADRELEKAKGRFRAEVVEMALELAEKRIRKKITVADEKKLVREYIDQLSSLGGASSSSQGAG